MVIYLSAAAASAQLVLQRECPGCHEKQIVPSKDIDPNVKCRRCGTLIPPKNRKAVSAASLSASFDGIWNENCEYQVKVKNAASRTQDHEA